MGKFAKQSAKEDTGPSKVFSHKITLLILTSSFALNMLTFKRKFKIKSKMWVMIHKY